MISSALGADPTVRHLYLEFDRAPCLARDPGPATSPGHGRDPCLGRRGLDRSSPTRVRAAAPVPCPDPNLDLAEASGRGRDCPPSALAAAVASALGYGATGCAGTGCDAASSASRGCACVPGASIRDRGIVLVCNDRHYATDVEATFRAHSCPRLAGGFVGEGCEVVPWLGFGLVLVIGLC